MTSRKIRHLKRKLREAQAELRTAMLTPDYESDAFIEAGHGRLGSKVSLSAEQRFIGEYGSVEEALEALKEWTEGSNYYPTLWFVDDHGGIELIDYDGNILDMDALDEEFGLDEYAY